MIVDLRLMILDHLSL